MIFRWNQPPRSFRVPITAFRKNVGALACMFFSFVQLHLLCCASTTSPRHECFHRRRTILHNPHSLTNYQGTPVRT